MSKRTTRKTSPARKRAPVRERGKATKSASSAKRQTLKRFDEKAFWDAVLAPYNLPDELDRAIMAIDDAIEEMLTPGTPREVVSPAPGRWSSALPEFRARPLTKEDYDHVMECLGAVAKVEAKGMTVMARAELAAAMMAMAGMCAYGSAEAQGEPSDGPKRYRWAEDFILRRAREIYGQDGG